MALNREMRRAVCLAVGFALALGVGGMAAQGLAAAKMPAAQEQASAVGEKLVSSATTEPHVLSYGAAGSHVTVVENTLIRVMTDQPISSKRSKSGMRVSFTLSEDVVVNHVLLVPRGATVYGEVVSNKKAGVMGGTPELELKLDSLELAGRSYPMYTYRVTVRGDTKSAPDAGAVVGAAELGGIAGSAVAGSAKGGVTAAKEAEDVGVGAALGAGAVVAAVAATPRPEIKIPAEAQMDFYLASPMSVEPVSAKEAEKLAQRFYPGDPVLYVRGDPPVL